MTEDTIRSQSSNTSENEASANKVSEKEIQQIMAKFDRESAFRHLTGHRGLIISLLLIAFSLFQLYSTWKVVPWLVLRPLHVGVVGMFAFLLYPARRKSRKDHLPWYDVALAIAVIAAFGYVACASSFIQQKGGRLQSWTLTLFGNNMKIPYQEIIGIVGTVLLMEACRRVVGLPIVIIASTFICVGLFGPYMPGFLNNGGKTISRIVRELFYTENGIFGTPIHASSSFIFLFILFGAFLEKTGVGEFFIDLANAISGHKRGGPAKVAVLTSALEGTVSGSSVANTVGSGSFTIPMMKKLGYRPEFAAAAEASASTGGQIMPPVMGAAAFLMCETLGLPYATIVKAAIIPALLYFIGIWVIIDLEARKMNLCGMSREEMPKLKVVMLTRGHLILPLIAIVYVLSAGYSYNYAPLLGILCAIIGSYIPFAVNTLLYLTRGQTIVWKESTEKPHSIKEVFQKYRGITIKDVITALEGGARSVVGVALACGVAGIISGMITLTDVGNNLSKILASWAGGSIFLILLVTMLTSIVLGMGVPTTANYLITSMMMAGVVAQALYPGMELTPERLLPAHMFTFYFGIVADITPPVALASMAGAAIAKSNPLRTGVESTRLAIAAFVVPYIFVLNPQMLMIDAHWYEVAFIAITAIVGIYGIGVALEQYWFIKATWYEVIFALVGGILMIIPGLLSDGIGFVLIALVYLSQKYRSSRINGTPFRLFIRA